MMIKIAFKNNKFILFCVNNKVKQEILKQMFALLTNCV